MWYEITYPFPNFNGAAVEVFEWTSNVILHVDIDVITYPLCDQNQIMLVKGALDISSTGRGAQHGVSILIRPGVPIQVIAACGDFRQL